MLPQRKKHPCTSHEAHGCSQQCDNKLMVRSLEHCLETRHAMWVQACRSSCSLSRSRQHRCSSWQLKTVSGCSKLRPNLQLLSSKPSKRWFRCCTLPYFFASGNVGFCICVSHHLGMYAVPLILCCLCHTSSPKGASPVARPIVIHILCCQESLMLKPDLTTSGSLHSSSVAPRLLLAALSPDSLLSRPDSHLCTSKHQPG